MLRCPRTRPCLLPSVTRTLRLTPLLLHSEFLISPSAAPPPSSLERGAVASSCPIHTNHPSGGGRESGMVSGVPGVSEIACAQLICHCLGFLERFHPRKIFLGLRTELLKNMSQDWAPLAPCLTPQALARPLPRAGFLQVREPEM